MLKEKTLDKLLALATFVVAFGVYLVTMAPTVSFWDCGEFLASASILGNPHPPGNPLFLLIGRLFITLLPLREVAVRMNVLSALAAAVTVALSFLFTIKFLRLVFKEGLPRFAVYMGGIIAALLVTFCDTFWFSAVEAEMYTLSMMVVMLLSWLTLDWYEKRGTAQADRIVILIAYISCVGMGISHFAFQTVPAIGLFLLIADKDTRRNIPLIVSGLAISSLLYDIGNFYFYAGASLIICVIGALASKGPTWKRRWSLSGWVCAAALIGFSMYLYVPIRSSVNPAVDEGGVYWNKYTFENLANPTETNAFKEYLERKQYGSESMISRAFHRRALVQNQVLAYPHMGYGGYLLAQYFPWKQGETDLQDNDPVIRHLFGKRFEFSTLYTDLHTNPRVQLLLFLLLQLPFLYGGYLVYKRNKQLGIYLLVLYAITSVGMIFYINFADGSQMEFRDYEYWKSIGFDPAQKPPPVHLEVRDRDYFFTPAFLYMGILFGVSASIFLGWLAARRRRLALGTGVALIVISAVVPAWSNWHEHNRSGNYVAWDYAYNLLMSCRPNSILFTNGDNDTFPLWFVQEAGGVRKDVRVVNLSLANTNWYIQQLWQHEPVLKLGFTPEEIDALEPQPWRFKGPVDIQLPNSKIRYALQPLPYLKVQDMVVLNLVQNNYPKHPIHFAVTVGSENTMGLDPYMVMEGLVYTLTEERHDKALDVGATAHMVDSVYRFRGLGDPNVFVDKNTEGLLTNYSATNFRLASWAQDSLQKILPAIKEAQSGKASNPARLASLLAQRDSLVAFAEKYLNLNARILPREWRVYYYEGQLYSELGDSAKSEQALLKGFKTAGPNSKIFAMNLAQMYLKQNRIDKAQALLEEARKQAPEDIEVVFGLAEVYQQSGNLAKARDALAAWLAANPGNEYAQMVGQQLQQLQAKMQSGSPIGQPAAAPR